jgi:hypothetical protein
VARRVPQAGAGDRTTTRARDGGKRAGPTRRVVAVERSPCCCCCCSAPARCKVILLSNASGAHQLWETTWETTSCVRTICAINVDKTLCPSPAVDSAIAIAGLPSSCAGPRGAQKWSHGKSSTLSCATSATGMTPQPFWPPASLSLGMGRERGTTRPAAAPFLVTVDDGVCTGWKRPGRRLGNG